MEIEPLSACERRLLLGAVKKGTLRDQLIVLLMLELGLTAQEICRLYVGDVCVKEGRLVLFIRHEDSTAQIVLSEGELAEILRIYIAERKRDADQRLLFGRNKRWLSGRAVYHIIKKYSAQAGINRAISPVVLQLTYRKDLLSGV